MKFVSNTELIVCEKCRREVYCSEECRDHSWMDYHSILCVGDTSPSDEHPAYKLENLCRVQDSPFALMVMKMFALVVSCVIRDGKTLPEALAAFSSFSRGSTSQAPIALLQMAYQQQFGLLQEIFQEYLSMPSLQELFTLVNYCQFTQMLQTNAQFIIPVVENFVKIPPEGVGIFCLHSAMNHSCVPNAKVCFLHDNFKVSVKSLRKIDKNEELQFSYVSSDLELSEKRRGLWLSYGFKCACELCIHDSNFEDFDELD